MTQRPTKINPGDRFGRLTVQARAPEPYVSPRGWAQLRWLCRCDCGNEIEALSVNLRQGSTRSCGCLRQDNSSRTPDVSGQSFGRLKAVRRVQDYVSPNGNRQVQWLFRCVCGTERVAQLGNVRSGAVTGCGPGCSARKKKAE